MSTNRMYIKCTGCNEEILLAKSMDHIEWRVWTKAHNSGAEYRQQLAARIEEIENWLSDHGACSTSIPAPFIISFDVGTVAENMNVYAIRAQGTYGTGVAFVAAADEKEAVKLAGEIKDTVWNVRYSQPDKIELIPSIKHSGASMVIDHHESGE